MKVNAKINADRASAEFKQARKDIRANVKKGLERAGERVALPAAKRNASGLKINGKSIPASLTVRASSRTAFLKTNFRGKQNRAVGLLEFGGTVNTPIRPKRAKALKLRNGRFVASVTGPRTYKAKHFLTRSVNDNQRKIGDAISEEVTQVFNGFEVR